MMTGEWASAGRRSGRLIGLVRDCPVPGGVERRRAQLGDHRVVAILLADPGPVTGEVIPQQYLVIEHPEVAARHQQPRCGRPWEPADLLPGRDVMRGRD